MAKGYWIGRVDVENIDRYMDYVAANAAPFAEYGAKFLVRGGTFESVEGDARSRNVVIEFPSYQAARECYDSDGYQVAKAIRDEVAISDLIIIEGYDG
ncbi:DUF1330 domain-containing protein [Aliiroseovarius marinus]|uniref:DUF1330 domain-containing protein n=1 Tax=Aliiroseovarius marinus TaxID=2500159 RepID=UPI00105DB127|nr:DUF1330 domain-containing protein [Aliiroseovarius marinus]